ncbi:MAG: hypothetical protein K2N14_01495 [Clostridia bacterium]|nr:hypothetical protein [Clostridia bacterium]
MGDNKNAKGMTKADVILQKVDKLTRQVASVEARVANGDINAVARRLSEENAQLKREISYISAQIEGLFTTLSKMIDKLPDKVAEKNGGRPVSNSSQPMVRTDLDVDDLASRVAAKIIIPDYEGAEGVATPAPAAAVASIDPSNLTIDYDALGYSVAKRLYVPQAIAEEVDYDALAKKVSENIPPITVDYDDLGYSIAKRIYVPQAIAEEVDYEAIAQKVIEKFPAVASTAVSETAYASAEPVSVQAELDYDLLAAKVAEAVAVQEPVSPDYIAARVAEQL